MKIFITNTHERAIRLFAKNLAHKLTINQIAQFDEINIYDIFTTNNSSYIFITDKDLRNQYVKKFIDIINTGSTKKDNKIVIIHSANNKPKISNPNVIFIPDNTFCAYDEHFELCEPNEDFILCEPNYIDMKKNSILTKVLYPHNKTDQIRVVNCPRFRHPQNVGVTSEKDMLDLISKCKLFITLNSTYIYDAINMKKPVITTEKNMFINPVEHIDINMLKNTKSTNIDLEQLNKYKISNLINMIIK